MLPPLSRPAPEIGKRFSKSWGRPTADLVTLTGSLLMAETFDWTVEESLTRLKSDVCVQMALGLPENPTDKECVVSERTYYEFRKKFLEANGPWLAALSITRHLCEVYCVEAEIVRLDSSDVRSNVKGPPHQGRAFPGVPLLLREGAREGAPVGGARP
ncbi:MAG: transposase [Deltaproteobacteria bacterium]|nr:transposase [Deltaproteobacteria bacterium]